MLLDSWKWLGDNVAEIIAVCALAFTAYQAHLSRRHNRLSVAPRLSTFSYRNSENGIGRLQVDLSNNGLGPATIDLYQIELDGVAQDFETSEQAHLFIQDLVGSIGIKNSISSLLPGHIISAGETATIVDLYFWENAGEGWSHIDSIADRLSLRIKYSSMYGEKLEYHSINTHANHESD